MTKLKAVKLEIGVNKIDILEHDWDCQICGGNHVESKCSKIREQKEEIQ